MQERTFLPFFSLGVVMTSPNNSQQTTKQSPMTTFSGNIIEENVKIAQNELELVLAFSAIVQVTSLS